MILYIDGRCKMWAVWRVTGKVLPVIARSSWQNLSGGGSSGQSRDLVPVNDIECKDIDTCVCALRPELKQAVIEAYTRIGTVETAAKRCGISPRTLFRRLDMAHYMILGWLHDLAAGIPVPAWSEDYEAGYEQGKREPRMTAVVLPEKLPGNPANLLPLTKSIAQVSQKV